MSTEKPLECFTAKKLSKPIKFAKFQYDYHHDGKPILCIHSFNIVIKVSYDVELVWTIKCSTWFDGKICEWSKIELKKCEKKVFGSFIIQAADDQCVKGNFTGNFKQELSRCKTEDGKITITFNVYYEDENEAPLINDLEKLLLNQESCDVTFVVGDEEIPAHKLILTARSEVFARMFDSEMLERETGRVEIIDIEPTIFKQLLRYIYCGRVDLKSTDEVHQLIVAADKYSVPSLVNYCASRISGFLSLKNVIDILIIADRVNANFLKEECIRLIIRNRRELSIKKGYEKLRQSHADLVCQLCDRVMDDE